MSENKTNSSIPGNITAPENDSSDLVIKASDPNMSAFSGTVTTISEKWNGTYVTLKTDYESYYGSVQMTFILNEDTHLDEDDKLEIGKYMFITYWDPADGNLKKAIDAEYASVTSGIIVINGTVEEIRGPNPSHGRRGFDIIAENGTLMECSNYHEIYYVADIKEGMEVTICCHEVIATGSPPICWPYEV